MARQPSSSTSRLRGLSPVVARIRDARLPLPRRRFQLARAGRLVGGVCRGIANTVGWPVVVVRLLTFAGLLLAPPVTLLGYLIVWVSVPRAPRPVNRRVRSKASSTAEGTETSAR